MRAWIRRARVGGGACLACLLVAWPVGDIGAQPLTLNQYGHRTWLWQDLLMTGGGAFAIEQADDGYLWMIARDNGLVRFDGVRADRWEPAAGPRLQPQKVFTMRRMRDGSLWIGLTPGLAIVRNGRVGYHPAFVDRKVISIFEDRAGVVWIGLDLPGKLCAVRNSHVTCHDGGQFGEMVKRITQDAAGNLWVWSTNGLWRWAPGPPRRYALPPSSVSSIAVDDSGVLVVATPRGLLRIENDELAPYQLPGVRGRFTPGHIVRGRHGGLWIVAQENGLFYLRDGKTYQFTTADGLAGNVIYSVFEDREGIVWISTDVGLEQLHPLVAPIVSYRQGLSSFTVSAVQATRDGSVWLATPNGVNRWRDGRITVYARDSQADRLRAPGALSLMAPPLTVNTVQSPVYGLAVDHRDRVWASTPDGLVHFDGQAFIPVSGSIAAIAAAIVEDRRGTVWSTHYSNGLYRRSRDGHAQVLRAVGPYATALRWLLAADPRRRGIWAIFPEVGVVYLEDGEIRETYGPDKGLSSLATADLRVGRDGTVWVSTYRGLNRIHDGRVTVMGVRNGLPCERVHWSIEDDDGALWMMTECGIVRIARAEVEAWTRDPGRSVHARVLGRHQLLSGYTDQNSYRPAVTRATDGRIWFSEARGAGVIDPRGVAVDETPPPVYVERVVAHGRAYDVRTTRALRVPPRPRALEIQFTALSLTMPEKVAFRFMLEGQDSTWREAVNQRRVEYSNLAPGRYRFRVLAANHDGVWNTAGASLAFTVAPAWNQTWWFRALVAVAIVGSPAVATATWQRRRARLGAERARARFDATLAERTRVARELHDTLLGDMAGLALQLGAVALRARASLGGDAPIVVELSGLGGQVRRALVEARRSVTAMRTQPDESPPLHEQLADAARRTFAETGAAASVEHEGSPRPYPPAVEAEVVAIVTEAMTNARRHAGCRTVAVTCRYAPDALEVRVRDDGRGFNPAQPTPAGHWGMVGMQERATSIGATLAVTSAPGAGTDIVVVLAAGRRAARWAESVARGQG